MRDDNVYVGDHCIDKKTNLPGICKLIKDCPHFRTNLREQITICSFDKFDPIICCITNIEFPNRIDGNC